MKLKIFALTTGFWLGLTAFAGADDVRLTAIMSTNKLSALEAAAVIVAADALGVNADFVISTGRTTRTSPTVYAPYMIYADVCGRSFEDVWKTRNKGWGEVAHSIGMHPGTFNKLRKTYSVEQIIWMDAMHRKYGIGYDQFGDWKKSGVSSARVLELVARTDGNSKSISARIKGGKDHEDHGQQGRGNSKGGGKGNSGNAKGGGKGNSGKGKGGGRGG